MEEIKYTKLEVLKLCELSMKNMLLRDMGYSGDISTLWKMRIRQVISMLNRTIK